MFLQQTSRGKQNLQMFVEFHRHHSFSYMFGKGDGYSNVCNVKPHRLMPLNVTHWSFNFHHCLFFLTHTSASNTRLVTVGILLQLLRAISTRHYTVESSLSLCFKPSPADSFAPFFSHTLFLPHTSKPTLMFPTFPMFLHWLQAKNLQHEKHTCKCKLGYKNHIMMTLQPL